MSLVSNVISDIRIEINDIDSTRFTDATILAILKQAVRRANRICQRSQLQFAKKKASMTTVAAQDYLDAPIDIDIPIGLWRDDLHSKITQKTESDWEQIIAAQEIACWFLDVDNNKIYFNGVPAHDINLTMWYFPVIDPSAYDATTTMPWNGKLDDIIARYVAMRLQNIEEQNTTQDAAILQDMEASIVSVYAPLSPLSVSMNGWL